MLLPMAVLPGVLPVDLSPCPPDVWKIEFANSAPALCTPREGNGARPFTSCSWPSRNTPCGSRTLPLPRPSEAAVSGATFWADRVR